MRMTLKFINTAEGRYMPATNEYQYHLKDHLGNVHLTFTAKSEDDNAVATYETSNVASEQSEFLRLENAKRVYSHIFDHTNGTSDGYAQRLTGGSNEKYGLAKSISVMPGDTIKMEVYAKYVDQNTANWTGAFNTLMGQVASGASTVVFEGSSYSSSTSSFSYSGYLAQTQNPGAPKAYLNWLIFDHDFNYINGGYSRLSANAKEYGQNTPHELLQGQVIISEPGYVYIYLSNEESVPVEVYFDDLRVEHRQSAIVQMDDYYPFGLARDSHQLDDSSQQKYLFGGKEIQNELNLGWLDFGARIYMSELGRWAGPDPHSDFYEILSPYTYTANNPVLLCDPDGKDNIIYLLATKGFNKEEAQKLAATATAILEQLGLKTEVRFYDQDKIGKFDASKLDKTDNWAVVGNNKREVGMMTRQISKNTKYNDQVEGWEKTGRGNSEYSSRGPGDPPNRGTGIAVDYSDPLIWKDKHTSAAVSTLHGAGHSSETIKALGARGQEDHAAGGIMNNANGIRKDYADYGGWDVVTRPATNSVNYIPAMQERYGTNAAKDNAFKGQVQRATTNTTKKTP